MSHCSSTVYDCSHEQLFKITIYKPVLVNFYLCQSNHQIHCCVHHVHMYMYISHTCTSESYLPHPQKQLDNKSANFSTSFLNFVKISCMWQHCICNILTNQIYKVCSRRHYCHVQRQHTYVPVHVIQF